MTGRKYEPPLYLDMDFEEALERFGTTDPKEVKELMERAKEKKPPGRESPDGQTPPNGYAVKQKQEAQNRRVSPSAAAPMPAHVFQPSEPDTGVRADPMTGASRHRLVLLSRRTLEPGGDLR